MQFEMPEDVQIVKPENLYKWAKIWGSVQKKYYRDSVYLRREKQIEDFVALNGFHRPFVIADTDVFQNLLQVNDPTQADIVIITDQKFSRYPCHAIIRNIQHWMTVCHDMILCLNRHYLNIDHSHRESDFSDNFNLAITQWLKKELPEQTIIDLSLDYVDRGDWFTWVIPDRIYYVTSTTR